MPRLDDADRALRQEFEALVVPLRRRWLAAVHELAAPLHLSGELRHGHPGWLRAQDDAVLSRAGIPIARDELAFAVPAECAHWHAAERRADGAVFRCFATRAWLETSAGTGMTDLAFTAAHWIHADAVDGLAVSCGEQPMTLVSSTVDLFGHRRLVYRRLSAAAGRFRVHWDSPVAGVVSDVVPGSTDHRYVSLAITGPRWVAPTAPA